MGIGILNREICETREICESRMPQELQRGPRGVRGMRIPVDSAVSLIEHMIQSWRDLSAAGKGNLLCGSGFVYREARAFLVPSPAGSWNLVFISRA